MHLLPSFGDRLLQVRHVVRSLGHGTAGFLAAGLLVAGLILLNFLVSLARYHWSHAVQRHARGQLPPRYPFFLPLVGALPIAWNTTDFLRRVTSYGGHLTSTSLSLLGFTFFVFQDRETVEEIWRQPSLSSSISIYIYSMKYLFGAPRQLMTSLRLDNSGNFAKPHPNSSVPSRQRIHYIVHDGLARGLTGPGLGPMTQRYMESFGRRMQELPVADEWVEMDDLGKLIKDVAGSAVVEALFGPAILALNPTFVDDLWRFESDLPWFARGIPSFIMPGAHRNRRALVDQILKWYEYAREHFDESQVGEDGDGDPFWGSQMTRHRQDTILRVDKQDDESLATLDLGLAWAAVANAVPSATLFAFHIFRDPELLARVRGVAEEHAGSRSLLGLDPKELAKEPLLASIYAEILRLYVVVYTTLSSPHEDVPLGRWLLPQGSLALLNAGVSHMDENAWNTQGQRHPLRSFWAERFLVDPADPTSGPVKRGCTTAAPASDAEKPREGKPYFSTQGLDGTWFPYGGGYNICPGRFFSKSLIIFTCAFLAQQYDVEISAEKLEFNERRDGMGVRDLVTRLPFRIRKRPGRNAQ